MGHTDKEQIILYQIVPKNLKWQSSIGEALHKLMFGVIPPRLSYIIPIKQVLNESTPNLTSGLGKH